MSNVVPVAAAGLRILCASCGSLLYAGEGSTPLTEPRWGVCVPCQSELKRRHERMARMLRELRRDS